MDPLWSQTMSVIDNIINEDVAVGALPPTPGGGLEEGFQEAPRFPVGSPRSLLKNLEEEPESTAEGRGRGPGGGGGSKKVPVNRRSSGSAGMARKKLAFDDKCLEDHPNDSNNDLGGNPDTTDQQAKNADGMMPDEDEDASGSSSSSESESECEITPEFLQVPRGEATWIDEHLGTIYLDHFFQMCAKRLENRHWTPYGLKDLPLPISYRKATPGVSSLGYVTRLVNPWNFHMIFEGPSVIDLMMDNDEWGYFFWGSRHKVNYLFQSSLQLYHGMSKLLVEYQTFIRQNPEWGPHPEEGVQYRMGDLVSLKLLRFRRNPAGSDSDDGDDDEEEDDSGPAKLEGTPAPGIVNGYRGVIKEIVLTRNATTMRFSEKHFVIYLLDTGEDVVVTPDFVTPLPRAFTGFPPMAVKCSLHGILPIGPGWSISATEKMKQLVRSQAGMKLFADFRPNSFEGLPNEFWGPPKPTTSTITLLRDFTCPEPLEMELKSIWGAASASLSGTGSPSTISINISEVLIDQYYGAAPAPEPCNIPFPGQFRKRGSSPSMEEEEGVQKKIRSVPDLHPISPQSKDAQIGTRSTPQQVGSLYSQQVDLESVSFFANEPESPEAEVRSTPDESNQVSIGVPEVGLSLDLT